jgi:hypothetical protein
MVVAALVVVVSEFLAAVQSVAVLVSLLALSSFLPKVFEEYRLVAVTHPEAFPIVQRQIWRHHRLLKTQQDQSVLYAGRYLPLYQCPLPEAGTN